MIIVRDYFTAKPGQASKLANMFKEVLALGGAKHYRIMTDQVGQFNQVVIETEYENVSEFERRMEEYGKNPAIGEKMKGYTDMYLTGGREIYRVVS